ncbi:MAG: hypothetical protein MRZ12_06030, partial [Bacteroidales bacterium]|nr:hypothetical protein [Bacteroidales bacterium]
ESISGAFDVSDITITLLQVVTDRFEPFVVFSAAGFHVSGDVLEPAALLPFLQKYSFYPKRNATDGLHIASI